MGSQRETSLSSLCTKPGKRFGPILGLGADKSLRHMVPFDQPEAALVGYYSSHL